MDPLDRSSSSESRTPGRPRRAPAALLVALGIGASRLAGLGRETIAARLLGNTAAGDAFAVALRIPNLLQNLLGEGVLSASFVPVYSQLLEAERSGEADDPPESSRVAGAVAAALMLVTGITMLLLITLARPITFLLAPGLSENRFELAVSLTRITTLGLGLLVFSAWCLGVLNSHRRFFLSYVAPVLWNAAQIAALVVAWILAFDLDDVARALAWGVAAGGLAQLLVQLPLALRMARGLRLRLASRNSNVRAIRRRFGPAVLGRGVVQLSAHLDLIFASLLATGAIAALFRAQILYTLPVSLFAMSVAAAELPEMSRLAGDPQRVAARSQAAARQVGFWMLLTAALYLSAGDLIVALLFEGGEFTPADTTLVWFILGGYALALPAIGVSRVAQNTSYALGDTRGPARIAALRVAIAALVGVAAMFPLDRVIVEADRLVDFGDALGLAWALPRAERQIADVVRLGALGLAVGSALAAWIELALLSRLLQRRLPGSQPVAATLSRPALAATMAFVSAGALKLVVGGWPVLLSAPLVVATATLVYAIVAHRCSVAESRLLLDPMRKLFWGRSTAR